MPIKIKQKLGSKLKEFNVLTKEELENLFGGNIARAGEVVGRTSELDKNLKTLNDVKLPDLDEKLGILDTELTNLDTKLYDLNTGDLPRLDEELGVVDGKINTLDGYFNDPSTIPSTYSFFTGIVAEQAWIDALVANQAWLNNLFVNNAFADRITANEILAGEITSNKINVNEFVGSTVFANEFIANEGYVDELIANNVFADKITANEINVADLFAQNITMSSTGVITNSTNDFRISGGVFSSGISVSTYSGQLGASNAYKIVNRDTGVADFTISKGVGAVTEVRSEADMGFDLIAGAGSGTEAQLRLFANGSIRLNSDTYYKGTLIDDLFGSGGGSVNQAADYTWTGNHEFRVSGGSNYVKFFRTDNNADLDFGLTGNGEGFLRLRTNNRVRLGANNNDILFLNANGTSDFTGGVTITGSDFGAFKINRNSTNNTVIGYTSNNQSEYIYFGYAGDGVPFPYFAMTRGVNTLNLSSNNTSMGLLGTQETNGSIYLKDNNNWSGNAHDQGSTWGKIEHHGKAIFLQGTGVGSERITEFRSGAGSNVITFYANGNAEFEGTSKATNHVGGSDRRIKSNFQQLSGLEIIRKAGNLYSYEKEGVEGREVGQIAQDLLFYPDLVHKSPHKRLGEMYSLSGLSLAGVAMNGVKELDLEFQQTKSEVDILKDKVAELEREIEQLRRSK